MGTPNLYNNQHWTKTKPVSSRDRQMSLHCNFESFLSPNPIPIDQNVNKGLECYAGT